MVAHNQRQQPRAGQESVWDYPRPPRVEPTSRRLRIIFNGKTIADTTSAFRILETSHPPAYYIPQEDIEMQYLTPTSRQTFCEFKGRASYWTISVEGQVAENAAWSYENPAPGFEAVKSYICFYANRVDAAYVDEEKVTPQAGDFYGGWITADVVGPFKGGPGTRGW